MFLAQALQLTAMRRPPEKEKNKNEGYHFGQALFSFQAGLECKSLLDMEYHVLSQT